MKPLKKEVIGDFTPKQHRDILVDVASEINGCCVKYKDGTFHQVSVKNIDTEIIIEIEDYDPWYEFENENELKNYIKTTNEEFDNFVRWQKLETILNEDEADPFKK